MGSANEIGIWFVLPSGAVLVMKTVDDYNGANQRAFSV